MDRRTAALSASVMGLARDHAAVRFRFTDAAVRALPPVPREDIRSFATDGRNAYYSPMYILREYAKDPHSAERAYLHLLMHCVFRHFFVSSLVDRPLWDIACDIAAENILLELEGASMNNDALRLNEIALLRKQLRYMTAEHIYRYYSDAGCDRIRLAALFSRDDHSQWYGGRQGDKSGDETAPGGAGTRNGCDENGEDNDSSFSDGEASSAEGKSALTPRTMKDSERIWRSIAERMEMEAANFSKQYGGGSGCLVQCLHCINREKYDYAEFLKQFAVYGEAMTYGLSLYRNMPLIEPLEYKEVRRIKEFAVAIDTSASVSGSLVKAFVRKTYNLLTQYENYFTKINLHIIQCDAEIREKVKITNKDELERYLHGMTLKGFMGTDFRPVFRYVGELIRSKEFTDLRGLIYFTDGCGTFPEAMPPYKTAFICIDDGESEPKVPVWAIKLILRAEDI